MFILQIRSRQESVVNLVTDKYIPITIFSNLCSVEFSFLKLWLFLKAFLPKIAPRKE